jgi:hypothetical protein
MWYFGTESSSFDASIPKVAGSIPTVARHIFQACPMWIYTQSNITSIIFTWVLSTLHQHRTNSWLQHLFLIVFRHFEMKFKYF